MLNRPLLVLVISAMTAFAQAQAKAPTLTPQSSGTTQLLIAVSPVNSQVVWAAGTGGVYTMTTDGGYTWKAGVVPGAESLQFRDVQGVSDKIAYLMSIGNNTDSFRIYKTEDAGDHWHLLFQNKTEHAFYDCFAFWTPTRGITHSDSVKGVFPDIRTVNGASWESIASKMPPTLPGEASFSSSGTCITTEGQNNAWITTGGSTTSRILATRDGGNTWNAYDTPLVSSPSAGGFSVAFRDPWHGIVGGGDLSTNAGAQAATSSDGGKTWTLTNKPPIPGAIFCLAYAHGPALPKQTAVEEAAAGTQPNRTVVITTETQPTFSSGAAAWSPDEGQTWFKLTDVSGYWAVAFADPGHGWFVGNSGKILKISF